MVRGEGGRSKSIYSQYEIPTKEPTSFVASRTGMNTNKVYVATRWKRRGMKGMKDVLVKIYRNTVYNKIGTKERTPIGMLELNNWTSLRILTNDDIKYFKSIDRVSWRV